LVPLALADKVELSYSLRVVRIVHRETSFPKAGSSISQEVGA